MKWWKKYSLIPLFCIGLLSCFAFNIENLTESSVQGVSAGTSGIESAYTQNFRGRMHFVDTQGLIAKAMNQKMLNGVIKGNNGKLNFTWAVEYKFNKEEEREKVKKAVAILEHAQNNDAKVLYVQRPWAVNNVPYGKEFEYQKQYDYWCSCISSQGIPVLDLRTSMEDELDFFITDHHWTMESAYIATQNIMQKIENIYRMDLAGKINYYFNKENYVSQIYEDSFLGAEGVRTGKYFAGKDDIEIIYPKFETDFSFKQFEEGKEYFNKSGSFKDVFIDKSILENDEYLNKYNAYAYGAYIENRVINNNSDNDLKTLIIADSFARPQLGLYSLFFRETRYLDPQEGRYNDSFIDYIDEYNPDIVIMMFPGDGVFKVL